MRTLKKIIRYCSDCKQKRTFSYIKDLRYQIINTQESDSIRANKNIILREYGCGKCESTLNCGYTIP